MLSAVIALALTACGGGGSSAPPPASTAPAQTLAAGIDRVIQFHMERGATAATVTVMRNSTVLHDKGYGYLDAAKTKPLTADAIMVAASLIKPVTAAAIQKLAAGRVLNTSDHVFCTGDNAPCWLPADLLPAGADSRAKDITILHLIAHQGGWDASVAGDLIDREREVAFSLGGVTPKREDNVRFLMRSPLQFSPGARAAYSNFGYLLLGMVIEKASNMTYHDYVNANIFNPMGVASTEFQGFAARIKDRGPREPNYISDGSAPSVMQIGTNARFDDGYINTANWASVGLSASTSKALATFAANYRIDATTRRDDGPMNGLPLGGATNDGYHAGQLMFSTSVIRQLPSGVTYVALINARSPPSTLQVQMDEAITAAGL